MTKQDILVVLPEIVISLMACFILVLDLYLPATKKQKFGYGLSLVALVVGAALSLIYSEPTPVHGLNGLVLMDSLSAILKAGICISTGFVLVYSRSYVALCGPGMACALFVSDGGLAHRLDDCVRSRHEILCIGRTGLRDIAVWHVVAVRTHRDAVYRRIVSVDSAL